VGQSASGFKGADFLQAIACDALGNLYVTEPDRIEKRDREGHWSVLATQRLNPGQPSFGKRLQIDSRGTLYVGEWPPPSTRTTQKRDPSGTLTVVCGPSTEPGVLSDSSCFAVDSQGSLYVLDNFR
jgi:hypothetical protein